TGAAKAMFIVRPLAFAPWDRAIREGLRHDGSAQSYRDFLANVSEHLKRVAAEASVPVTALPEVVGRAESSPPKLIDEYYWVTFAKGCTPPSPELLAKWHSWAS